MHVNPLSRSRRCSSPELAFRFAHYFDCSVATLFAVGAAFGLAILAFVAEQAIGLVGLFVAALAFDVSMNDTATLVLVAVLLGKPLVLGLSYAYIRWRSLPFSVALPSREESKLIGGIVAVSVVAALTLNVVRSRVIESELSTTIGQAVTADPTFALVVGVLSVVLIAPAEEFLYRGVIQRRLGLALGTRASIVGASAIFGAYHLLNFQGSIAGILATVAIIGSVSLLWGYGYERTDNFAVPVLAHGLYNFTLMALSYVQL